MQGDFLSLLLFILEIQSLTKILHEKNFFISVGVNINNLKPNYLLFMNDLKLFAKSDLKLVCFLKSVKTFFKIVDFELNTENFESSKDFYFLLRTF